MPTNLQITIERQRAVYESLAKPLLYQMAMLHRLSIREFAAIFQISKGHAEAVLKHQVAPNLELAFRIARYFEVRVDDLFGWMFDDVGVRRPLLVEVDGKVVTIPSKSDSLEMVVNGGGNAVGGN